MIQVTQSPFLQALGFAIINSLWQFAVLWLVYVLTNSIFKLSSSRKYAAALTLQFAGFTWFVGTLVFYYQQCKEMAEVIMALPAEYAINTTAYGSSVKDNILSVALKGEQLLPYLSLAYIILLIVFSIKTIQCYRKLNGIRTHGLQKINGKWRVFIQQLSLQLGIRREVKIYVSALVDSPVAVGFIKPLILLPIAIVNNLTAEQIEAVLLHEMAHIKRHDYLINLFLSVIEMTLFFNPFMQLISKDIKRERENSCDDWVLQYQYNAASYAKALLTIAKNRNSSTRFAQHATDDNRVLLQRVKRMIEKKDRSYNYRRQLAALVLMTSIISSVAWLTPSPRSIVKTSQVNTNEVVIVEPLAAKVENPLFNPVFFLANDEESKKLIEDKKTSVTFHQSTVTVNHLPSKIVTRKHERLLAAGEAHPPVGMKSAAEIKFTHYFGNDTDQDTLGVQFQKVLNKSLSLDWKKIEQDIEKANKEIEASKWKVLFDSKEVKDQLKTAYEQLKKLHIQNKHEPPNALVKQEIRKTIEPKPTDNKANRRIAIVIETEDLKKQLHELEQQRLTLAHIPDEVHFSLDVPKVVYSPAVARTSSSHNYKSRQQISDNCIPAQKARAEAMKRRALAEREQEKEEIEADSTDHRKSCEKPVAKKLKTARI